MVIWKINQVIDWIGPKEGASAAQVDVLALSTIPPLKIALIQVKSLFGNNHTLHVKPKNIAKEKGPVWVGVVETNVDQYAYLVFTYDEIRTLAKNSKLTSYKGSTPQYCINVPKSLKGYEQYQNEWHKIEENSDIASYFERRA
jgi:hypothetical protein